MKKHIILLVTALLALSACDVDDDDIQPPPANNGQNNGANNGVNNGTNNGANNGANNGTNNGANNGTNNGANNGEEPGLLYAFESRSQPGVSSVSYDGQVIRQLLISDLKKYMEGLQADIEGARFTPTDDGQVVAALDFYFRFDSESNGEEAFLLTTDPAPSQELYNDVSSGKTLVEKLAGNDASTDHVDWSTGFQGWSDPSIAQYGGATTSPTELVTAFFETMEENALALSNGEERLGPGGEPLPVHVTASGLDLVQLTQKFLGGAIAFHQGADDYLDDDIDGKGILSPNARVAESPYSPLEHAWDEGFGYFGAARDYAAYTDDELAAKGGREGWAKGYHDSDGDGAIDLLSEYNFAASVNAASRDRGSKEGAKTDFTQQAIEGFVGGRALIHDAGDALTEAELTQLRAFRDQAIGGWEGAIAATVVHYVNDTLKEMGKFNTDGYDFLNHAKVWGELKGFALWFQFNPRSPLSKEDFGRLHTLLRDAPVLATASPEEIDQYRADLREARALIGEAFGFDAANLGDDQGEGGW